MADDPPQWIDDFSSDGNRWNGGGSSSDYEREGESNQRPLQLPRVGWGTEDCGEDGTGDTAQDSTNTEMDIPAATHDESHSVVSRAMSRNSEGELASIPEDISMHGTWPDYYPDVLGCGYDYDDERCKYKYRRCAPNFKQRLYTVILIAFAAIIGFNMSSKLAEKQKQHIPQPSNSDSAASANGNVSGNSEINDKYQPAAGNNNDLHSETEIYQVIVDTLNPIMFDDSIESWDGTYFHAYELCGATYSRVPCPYIAYCPLGPGKAPLGGTKIDLNESWAPIFGKNNKNPDVEQADWVQLGRDGTCDLYSKMYGHQPSWKDTVREDAPPGITRHVMCCREVGDAGEEAEVLNDPDFINRPPSLEEDEAEKPIPIREEEP